MMNDRRDEVERIRDYYAERDRLGKRQLYSWDKPDVLYADYQFKRAVASLLVANGMSDFGNMEILDVGCGQGGWLRTLLEWGASPGRLHGVDLLPDRIESARIKSPAIDFQVMDGRTIPFTNERMDMVSAHTVFSSILEPVLREALAGEMMRVLKPDGVLLVSDFHIGAPNNPNTIGIGRAEIQRLFPQLRFKKKTYLLAPPLLRWIGRFSQVLPFVLEGLFPFLRTHAVYLGKR